MDWTNCMKKALSKEITSDKNLIESLLNSAENKIKAESILPKDLPEPKISLIYDALRTILEALALKKGFKIYNHECYTAFLKEIMNESALGDKFDEYRKLRNAINYYGKQVEQDEAKELIKGIKELIKIFKKKF